MSQWLDKYGPVGERLGAYLVRGVVEEVAKVHKEGAAIGNVDIRSVFIG